LVWERLPALETHFAFTAQTADSRLTMLGIVARVARRPRLTFPLWTADAGVAVRTFMTPFPVGKAHSDAVRIRELVAAFVPVGAVVLGADTSKCPDSPTNATAWIDLRLNTVYAAEQANA
jgi:hypothetical protein